MASFDRDGEDRAEGRREEKLRSLWALLFSQAAAALERSARRPRITTRLPAVSHIASIKYPTLLNDSALAKKSFSCATSHELRASQASRFGRDIGASASVHQRRGRAPKTPTLLDVLGVRGRLKHQSRTRSPASAGLEHTSYSVIDTYRRGWHYVKAKSCH